MLVGVFVLSWLVCGTAALSLAAKALSRHRSGEGRTAGGSRRRTAAVTQRQSESWSISACGRDSPAARGDARRHHHHERAGRAARSPGCCSARPPSLRAGAPYWVMHRADLQAALQAEVNDHPDIDLRLGCQFEDVTSHARGLTVVQRRGNARQQELAAALIGADGIWSAVRNHLFPEVQPQFSGLIAWRGTLDATTLPREYTRAAGASSGWGRTHIWSPTRSRRHGRSTWSRSYREPGTGRAGARRAMPTNSRPRSPRSAGPRPRGC